MGHYMKDSTTFAYELMCRSPLFQYADRNNFIRICIVGIDEYTEEIFKAAVWSTMREWATMELEVFASREDCERMNKQYYEVFNTEHLADKDDIPGKCTLHVLGEDKPEGVYGFMLFGDVPDSPEFSEAAKSATRVVVLTDYTTASDGNRLYIPKFPLMRLHFMDSIDLEPLACELFCSFGDNTKERFYGNEFCYRSSMAAALFWKLRLIHGEKTEVCEATMRLEHRRWNAFTRTEGYRFGEKYSKTEKTHPCLVPWEGLTPEMQEYDAHIIKLVNNKDK